MQTNAGALKKREKWPDIARGLCAMLVILSHVPNVPTLYKLFYSPFMIPLFYIVSGYLTKNYGGKAVDFFYNKVLKELILKFMVVVSLTTFSVTTVVGFFTHPSTISDWLWDTLMMFFFKPRALFFSVLVLCSVCFFIINKLCRDKPLPMLMVGGALAVMGIVISHPHIIRLWGWDTALVCEFFYLFGYCARQRHWFTAFSFKAWHGLLTAGLFLASATICAAIFGLDNAVMIVMNNTWPFLPITLVLLITGNTFLICLSNLLPENLKITKLITYIGQHSLIFFMLGGPIMAYLHYFVELLRGVADTPVLKNNYLMSLVIWLSACLLTLIPCLLSDKFLPALNGSFKLPANSPQKHPKAWITACASAVCLIIGVSAAYVNGIVIPNQVYARHYEVIGVDVSSYQGDIDWPTLAAQDIQFAFIKATEGSSYADEKFDDNWQNAAQTDLAVGAYHFFSYDSAGSTQADNFIAHVPVREDSLPPVVDVEFYGDKERNLPEKENVSPELHALLDQLEAYYGQKPIIYATEKSYVLYIWDEFDDYDIWIRNVVTDTNLEHWNFWQYTDKMKLNGYDGQEQFIDMNVFSGTAEEWKELLASTQKNS